jgi:ABC-type nitrate/sulfonate/bicarbonate transport system substrate-binding protein
VSVIEVADSVNLVSNGLVVGADLIDQDRALVQALVTGTLQGIAGALDDPAAAFDAVLKEVPATADPAVKETQRKVLDASLRLWEAPRLGAIDRQAWETSQSTMRQLGLIDHETPIEQLTDSTFVDAAAVTRPR